MAKKDAGEIALSILGGLALGAMAVGTGFALVSAREQALAEYDELLMRKVKLERRTLTIGRLKEYRRIEARMEELFDILH